MENGRHLTVYVRTTFFDIVYLSADSWYSCFVEKVRKREGEKVFVCVCVCVCVRERERERVREIDTVKIIENDEAKGN